MFGNLRDKNISEHHRWSSLFTPDFLCFERHPLPVYMYCTKWNTDIMSWNSCVKISLLHECMFNELFCFSVHMMWFKVIVVPCRCSGRLYYCKIWERNWKFAALCFLNFWTDILMFQTAVGHVYAACSFVHFFKMVWKINAVNSTIVGCLICACG